MTSVTYPSATQRATFPSKHRKPLQKIALEEAISTSVFNSTATLPPSEGTAELPHVDLDYVGDVKDRLSNIEARIESMNHAGIALAIVSITMPGIEGIFDTATAVDLARKTNDETYRLYTNGKYAHRFRAFGCVAMQDPKAAVIEAERCVKELGFMGVLVNGYCNIGGPNQVQYLDAAVCEPFWAKIEELDIPFYLHPRRPPPNQLRIYEGYDFLAGSPWGFGVETATHAIRLMVSGLFDRHPKLRIILGHCGEGLPFSLDRIDQRIRHFRPDNLNCKLKLREYWERNFWVTTAGVSSDGALRQTLQYCGEDRVMWSVDYPYEDNDELGEWFDKLEISENTRANLGWRNAERFFNLKSGGSSS